MQSKNKISNYWTDVLFQASGNSVAQLIGILGLPILTRLYTPENFADQAIFIQITVLMVAFVTFRFEYFVPILKSKSESMALSAWVAKTGLLMSILFTLILSVLDWFGWEFLPSIKIEYYYYLAPITAYLISLSFLYQHEAQRIRNYKLSGVAEVISKSIYILSGVVGSLFSTGLTLILTTAFGALGKIVYLRQYVLSKKSTEFSEIQKKLISLYRGRAVGMILANTLLTCSSLIPLYVIDHQYGAVTMGQFALVMATVFLPSGLIGSAVGNVFYQRAGLFWNVQEYHGMKVLWSQTMIKLIVLAVPIYACAYFIAPWAYPFIFGSAWVEAGKYAQIMSLAAFFSFIAGPVDRLSLVLGLSYYLPVIHLFRLALLTLFSFFIMQRAYAATDYVIGYAFVLSIVYFLDIIVCRYYLNVKAGRL